MKTLNTTERGLIAALVILDIVSILLLTYNVIFDRQDMIPIFLIIMPAIYFETKQQLKAEQDQDFQYKKILWLLFS
ncbi:MAG: hypothetical protein ACFFC3_12825, partial [Candidatus Odinarchaeota archaeon]